MATDVEAIWEALRERIATLCPSAKTVTRILREQRGIEEYPLVEIVEKDEDPATEDERLPDLLTLTGVLGISVRVNDSASPWTPLNAIIREVRDALERQDGDTAGWNNLGGLVQWVHVGRVTKTPGTSSGEAWAKIELEMLTTN